MTVKKSDFEVMDALEMDSIKTEAEARLSSKKPTFQNLSCLLKLTRTHIKLDADDLSQSPTGEYTDEFPVRGVNTLGIEKPPYLPPQLLNIVLNKDVSAKVRL